MMTVSGQHFLKIEADDNKLGHVANAVKNKTKRIIEDFKNQGFFFTSNFSSKIGNSKFVCKMCNAHKFKNGCFDALSVPRNTSLCLFIITLLEKQATLKICVLS